MRLARAPGRVGRIENALSYLIHAKDPGKFQYAFSDVFTLRGLDYVEVENASRRAWARRAVMARQVAMPAKEWAELGDILVQCVLDDDLEELDILADKTLTDIYTLNQAKVDLWPSRSATVATCSRRSAGCAPVSSRRLSAGSPGPATRARPGVVTMFSISLDACDSIRGVRLISIVGSGRRL